jgi:hypothetical protein
MGWLLLKAFALDAPCREFAPAGDLLFERPKSRQKVAPRSARPLGLPCAAQALRARAKLASLRCAQTVARSQSLKRAAHAPSSPSAARRAQGGTAGTATTEGMWRLAVGCFGCFGLPLQNRREAQQPRARAQRASTSDFAPLCLSVVSKANEASWARPWVASIAGHPEAQRRGGFAGAALCLLSGGPESRSPAGAKPRHGPPHQHRSTIKQPAPHAAEQPQ